MISDKSQTITPKNIPDLGLLLSNSTVVEILDHNSLYGFQAFLYKNNEDNNEFILLMRKKINEDITLTKDNIVKADKIHENDIFHKFNIELKEYEKYEIEVVYSKELISKYKKKIFVLVRETPEIYLTKVKPYIETIPDVKFIQNILYKGTEPLVKDGGDFAIVKDYKYKSPSDHYYLCLIRGSLRSLRDLSTESLPLLEGVKSAKAEVEEKFNLKKGQLQAFLHYYPSFYHLHFHFVDLNLDNLSNKINRAFDLDDIIDNLKIDGDYYKKKTLTIMLDQDSELYKKAFTQS